MKNIYIFDEDDKYGAPKAGLELVKGLKSKYNVTPIVLTSKNNNVNKICNELGIENYVTHHHKYTYVKSQSFYKYLLKLIPRFIRYKIGNIRALRIISKKIDMKAIDNIHTNISAIDIRNNIS